MMKKFNLKELDTCLIHYVIQQIISIQTLFLSAIGEIYLLKNYFIYPFLSSGVLDVNGSTVSSDDIAKSLLHKIKDNGTNEQMNNERVYIVPHSSKPVNEYFNPKLLAGLYPTLFCYGRGVPENQ